MIDTWFSKSELSRFFAMDVDSSVVLPSSYDPMLVGLSFFVATLAGIAGGVVVGWSSLDINPGVFLDRLRRHVLACCAAAPAGSARGT